MREAFIGRQPIYREGVDVFAYELFSRNCEQQQSAFSTGDTVTAEAVLQECMDIGVARLMQPQTAFINVTRDFVLNGYSWFLPKNAVVLQVAGDTPIEGALQKSLAQLSDHGYSIALKDLADCSDKGSLAEFVDIVKLNVRKWDRGALSKQAETLSSLDVKLLAEDVDTQDDYEFCKQAGFDYFEGYHFCKPKISSDGAIPSNRLSTLHLLATLQNPDVTMQELEHAVGQDLAMTHRILRHVNSPINAIARTVGSIRHAISLVGLDKIRQWASVIWLNDIEEKPRELMVMSVIRAHMCQQLGVAFGRKDQDQFFTVGLLSLLDALIDRPVESVLKELPLTAPVKDALINRSGTMGEALKCAQAYERCDWENTTFGNLSEQAIREAYLNGVTWSKHMLTELVR